MQMDVSKRLEIMNLIEKCRSEPDLDKQIRFLFMINAMLPPAKKLHIPSFLTDDYITRALYEIEKAV